MTEPKHNYEDTLLNIVDYSRNINIPYKYELQISLRFLLTSSRPNLITRSFLEIHFITGIDKYDHSA